MSALRAALGRGDLGTSLIFILPLFFLYGVGVLFADTVNGVDFITRFAFAAVGADVERYLMLQGTLLALFFVLLAVVWRRRPGALGGFFPLVLESAIYALTLGSLIVFAMQHLLGFPLGLAVAGGEEVGVWEGLVISAGAGVHEELVFRLGLMAGGGALLIAFGVSKGAAVGIALLISSALFSAAHHVGPLGDPFTLEVFTYRFLAGVVFGLIFYFRSLAHAVYAHFLYDVYVLVIS